MKNKRLKFFILFLSLFFYPVVSYTEEIGGWVITSYEDLYLVRTEAGSEEVVFLKKDIHSIRNGDYIRVKVSKETAGIKTGELVPVGEVEFSDPKIFISTSELFNLINSVDHLIIDLRPYEKYRAGHIPSAVSLPHDRLRPEDLPDNRTIVLYSDSLRDSFLKDIAEKALLKGKSVRVYMGLERWIRDGYYVMVEPLYIKQKGKEGFVFIDTRASIETHIPGAIPVVPERLDIGELFRGEAGYPIIFYGEDEKDNSAERAALIASLSGYSIRSQEPVRILKGGIKAWIKEGLPVEKGVPVSDLSRIRRDLPEVVSYEEFLVYLKENNRIILDVRSEPEVERFPVNGTINIPLAELPHRLSELPRDKEIIIFCSLGIRAELAYYILKKNGYNVRYVKERLRGSF